MVLVCMVIFHYNILLTLNVMLMKKISLLLMSFLALSSCEQGEMDYYVKSDVEQVKTRATSSIADFNPLSELAYIPVNVINVGSLSSKYLTVGSSEVGARVRLASTDDGSLKQRWFVRNGNLILAMGNNSIAIVPKTNGDPVLGLVSPFSSSPFVECKSNFYNIRGIAGMWPSSVNLGCLQAKDKNSSDVRYAADSSSDIAYWQVVPVGEFNIVKMEYEKSVTYNDFIEQQDVYVEGAVFGDLPSEVQHVFNVSHSKTAKSSFSKAVGVTVQKQNSFGFSLGIGDASKVHIGFDGKISNTITSAETLTWGEETIETMTVSQTFTVPIPAHTPCRVEILWRTFRASITYVATLEKVDGIAAGERFRIKGKWNGVTTSDLYYNIYNTENNKLINTKAISQ